MNQIQGRVRTAAAMAAALAVAHAPRLPMRPVNRACVASGSGRCLACDAGQGEPCRRQAAND